jgi:hypothetical protein
MTSRIVRALKSPTRLPEDPFIKDHYSDDFWLRYSAAIYPALVKYLYSEQISDQRLRETADAVEAYVTASSERDEKKTASLYMDRVYGDSDHYLRLSVSGVGFLSVQWLMDGYTIFRDAYCKVTQGMPYESLVRLSNAVNQVEREGEVKDSPVGDGGSTPSK